MTHIRLGSRGSPLALIQADLVRQTLQRTFPETEVSIHTYTTTGDRVKGPLTAIGGKGLFTQEIERALQSGEIDVAVHSLKDMPGHLHPGTVLGGVLSRGDPRDTFLSTIASTLEDLPQGARVGTSSPRRTAYILSQRPDLHVVPLRGNIATRLEKLLIGEVEAALLAQVALDRLGIGTLAGVYQHSLPVEDLLPAVGQGVIALQCRREDTRVGVCLAAITDKRTWIAVEAERSFLRAMGGSCYTPMAAYAAVGETTMTLDAALWTEQGEAHFEAGFEGTLEEASLLGEAAAEAILEVCPPEIWACLNGRDDA